MSSRRWRRVMGILASATTLGLTAPSALADPIPGTPSALRDNASDDQGRLQDEFPLRPTDRVPPGYHVEERTRQGPFITGVVVAGVPYVIGLTTLPGANSRNAGAWLALPVLGPWLTLQERRRCEGLDCLGSALDGVILVFDGLLQTTGALLMTIGVVATRPWAVRGTTLTNVSLVPTAAPDGSWSLRAVGAF